MYIERCPTPLIDDILSSLLLEDTMLYQDKAPCHAGQRTQRFLKENLPAFLPAEKVSPSSPDLNVMDYRVWPFMKQELSKVHNIRNFGDLKGALMKV